MGCGSIKETDHYMIADPKSKDIEGETICHINYHHQDTEKYVKECENETIIGDIIKALVKYHKNDCLGYRKPKNENEVDERFTWVKCSEVEEMAANLSENLVHFKLFDQQSFEGETGQWKIIGIFARNCIEWVITDLACQINDVTSVAFYATLGSESFRHIFKQTQISTIFLSPESIPKFIDYYRQYYFESVKNAVIMDFSLYLDKDRKEQASLEELGIRVLYFKDLIKKVSPDKIQLTPASPKSIITLCYTSGTTSLPKGAMLTQNGFACQKFMNNDTGLNLTDSDVILSYLPLAHVLERLNVLLGLSLGVKFGFASNVETKKSLMDDLAILKPTVFVTVPRILVSLHQRVMDEFQQLTGCRKTTAYTGLEVKRKNYDKDHDIHHWYYDSLVFSKIKDKLGGKVRCVIVGSAPIPIDIARDIKIMLSCPLIEGYGMTELSGASNATHIRDKSNLNVGGVLRVMKMKLIDHPDLNYHSKLKFEGNPAPTGEICYYGPCAFKGYFRDPQNTSEVLDEEGWVHTGDIGRIDPVNKGLKIIDRVKEIFKLSQGEYIAPAKLESLYIKSPYITQVCVYGNSEKSFIIAICVINKAKVTDLLLNNGLIRSRDKDIITHLDNDLLHEAVKGSFEEIARQNNFTSLEKPSKIILTIDEFTVQNELLTPSMKLIRQNIKKHFQTQIDKVYNA